MKNEDFFFFFFCVSLPFLSKVLAHGDVFQKKGWYMNLEIKSFNSIDENYQLFK